MLPWTTLSPDPRWGRGRFCLSACWRRGKRYASEPRRNGRRDKRTGSGGAGSIAASTSHAGKTRQTPEVEYAITGTAGSGLDLTLGHEMHEAAVWKEHVVRTSSRRGS